jgi:hypothetical protein
MEVMRYLPRAILSQRSIQYIVERSLSDSYTEAFPIRSQKWAVEAVYERPV